jgi:hypothetical protein
VGTQLERLETLEARRDDLWEFCREAGTPDDWCEYERTTLELLEALIDPQACEDWLAWQERHDPFLTPEE